MRYVSIPAIFGLLIVPALADAEFLPITDMHYATYRVATGQLVPTAEPEPLGRIFWSAAERAEYYYPQMALGSGSTVLDWGDVEPFWRVGAFSFSYGTDLRLPESLTAVIHFYSEENGRNSCGRVELAGFEIPDLPTGGDTFNAWTITVNLAFTPLDFTIDGSDLDFDSRIDFGYSLWFTDLTPTPDNHTGPTIAGDPNVEDSGIEDVFDRFAEPDLTGYAGPDWFGGDIYAQFYMELFEPNWSPYYIPCPLPGTYGKFCFADIADGYAHDCIVDLADLATLLANYGTTSGADWRDGDIDPFPPPIWSDGDVDLGDLAELLSQYGDRCD